MQKNEIESKNHPTIIKIRSLSQKIKNKNLDKL